MDPPWTLYVANGSYDGFLVSAEEHGLVNFRARRVCDGAESRSEALSIFLQLNSLDAADSARECGVGFVH